MDEITDKTLNLSDLISKLASESQSMVLHPMRQDKLENILSTLKIGVNPDDFDPIYLSYSPSQKKFTIIDGHHRVAAFKKSNISRINCTISINH